MPNLAELIETYTIEQNQGIEGDPTEEQMEATAEGVNQIISRFVMEHVQAQLANLEAPMAQNDLENAIKAGLDSAIANSGGVIPVEAGPQILQEVMADLGDLQQSDDWSLFFPTCFFSISSQKPYKVC